MCNIKIVGTHHFMSEDEIRKEIDNFKPEIVMIELCKWREHYANNPTEEVKSDWSILGVIAKSIRKKAKEQDFEYGSDMINAYKIAKEKGLQIELIDRPLPETKALFSTIPMKEKYHFVKEIFKFNSKKIDINDLMKEVDNSETIKKVLESIKDKCPLFFYYIVKSRDEYMINKIKRVLYDNPGKKAIIFVGKGHLKEIEENINDRSTSTTN